MNVLLVSRWFPYPPDNGSRIRVFNLIKHLSRNHEIHLVSFAVETITEERLAAMRRYCRRVDVVLHESFEPNRLKALLGFFCWRPRSVVDTYSVEMQRLIEQAQRVRAFDIAIGSQIDTAPYVTALPGTPKILEEMELTTLYERLSKERHPVLKLRKWSTWWKLSRYVTDLLRASDGCTVVSERERERVLQVLPGYRPIEIVPNGVDLDYYAADFGPPEADTLVYPGALTYGANFDAVDFFLRDVFPLIRARRPDARLSVTGKVDGVPIDRLPDTEGIVLTGYLDDVRPTVAQSWACVVPLRVGGGTRLKILEALALGTPVVSTSKGAEGLEVTPGEDILIADDPAEFADVTMHLLGDRALRAKLAANGRRLVREWYGWDQIGERFDQFLYRVVQKYGQSGAQ
jgi:glycosyltransferase involved in cell wall biosynthesis